jgi:hypothetical protein
MVSQTEAHDLAETMDTMCVECSALSGEGVHEAACVMVHMAVYGQKPKAKGFFKKKELKRQKLDVPLDSLIFAREFYGMGMIVRSLFLQYVSPLVPGPSQLARKS